MSYRALYIWRGVIQKNIFAKSCNASAFQHIKVLSACYSSEQKLKLDSMDFKTETNIVYAPDPDTFGTLSGKWPRTVLQDEGDLKEEKFLENIPMPSQRLSTKQYADLIKQYVKQKRLKEALNVLEVKMISEDRVKPENYIYNILIGAFADVGYTKKAFKLYNDMKRRGLKISGDTYTCLFTACANSPWPADGLKNAAHLRQLMKEKGIEPNLTNYNAMIKAFGRCGDISTAFEIVDEMISKKIKIRVHTFNFLLQSCISDKENGLRLAVLVWRKMLLRREKPNIYSFNLMLKCTKDCKFGSKDDIIETLSVLSQGVRDIKEIGMKDEQLLLETNVETDSDSTQLQLSNEYSNSSVQEGTAKNVFPNLLSKNPQVGEVISLQEVSKPQEKFAFIGGVSGFLQEMKLYNVKPDLKTVTQMLPLIPDTVEAENELMCLMKELDLKGDIAFYNSLIKKRCFRLDYDAALAVKSIIEEENKLRKKKHPMKKKLQIKLDLLTYGALAMTCETKEDAVRLLSEMREAQIKINIEILGTMLSQGTTHYNFGYIIYIMQTAKEESLKVNYAFMDHVKKLNKQCEPLREKDSNGKRKCSEVFAIAHGIYMKFYGDWLAEMKAAGAFETAHPWRQFTETQLETVQRQDIIKPPKRYIRPKRRFIKPYRA